MLLALEGDRGDLDRTERLCLTQGVANIGRLKHTLRQKFEAKLLLRTAAVSRQGWASRRCGR